MKRTILSTLVAAGLSVAAEQNISAPQFNIPKVRCAPDIDGIINPGEWESAAGLGGFVNFGGKQLDSRGMEMYACYDAENLYLAFRMPYYPVDKKPGANWNRRDIFPPKGFEEDRVEILLDPNYGQHTVQKGHFTIFFNAAGNVVFDRMWTVAEGNQPDWNVKAKSKSRLTDEFWELECAIPFAELNVEVVGNNERWFIHASRYWSDFGAWTTLSPVAEALDSHSRGATMIFSEASPGYRIFFPQPSRLAEAKAEILSPVAGDAELSLRLIAGNKSDSESGNVALSAGKKSVIAVSSKLAPAEKNMVQLSLRSGEDILYQAAIPFLRNPVLPEITADMREKKFIFMCRYLPYFQKAWIDLLDFSSLAIAAGADSALFRVSRNGSELFCKTLLLSSSKLEHFEVPLPNVIREDGKYILSISLRKGDLELASEFMEYEYVNFPFVGSKAGTTIEIFPGFTPLRWQKNIAETVCARFAVGRDSLFEQIHAVQNEPTVGGKSEALLAAPMRLTGRINGRDVSMSGSGLRTVVESSTELRLAAAASIGDLRAKIDNVIEYDGLSWICVTLEPERKTMVERLTLEIPMDPARATLMYEITDKRLDFIAGATSREPGVIWDSMRQPNTAGTFGNFKPMVWVGNEDMGLTWCAESDRYWSLDERKPALELVREHERVVLLVHFFNKPMEIEQPRTISFGIQPTPSKPLPDNWRSWLVGANPALPNIKSFHYSAAVSFNQAQNYHAWCSYNPYPACYDTARKSMDEFRNRGQIFLRYQLVDWIRDMLKTPEGRVYRGEWERVWMNSYTRSFQDFKAYHYDQYLKNVGFFTVYEDEAYLRPMRDLALNAGYLRPDGHIQAEFGIRGLRETLRRCAAVWLENNMPNMYAVHKSCVTMTPCHSFAAISIDGEQRFMDSPDRDYIDNWPLDFIRAHVMGRQFGVVPVFLSEVRISAGEYGNEVVRKANRSMLALNLLHDIITWHAWNAHTPTRDMVHRAKSDFDLGHNDVRFHPYWALDEYTLCHTDSEQVKVSCWKKGRQLFMVVANLGEDAVAEISFMPEKIGFSPGKAVDYETQIPYQINSGAISVPIPRHDFRIIFAGENSIPAITARAIPPEKINTGTKKAAAQNHTEPRPAVKDDLLFHASFGDGLNAISSIGNGAFRLAGRELIVCGGRPGKKAVVIGDGGASSVEYLAENNFFAAEGTVALQVSPINYKSLAQGEKGIYHLFYLTSGAGANRWGLQIQRDAGNIRLALISIRFDGRKDVILSTDAVRTWENGQWYQVVVAWDANEMVLYLDGLVAARRRIAMPYRTDDFAGKIIKLGYEMALPGKEQTAISELRVFSRRLTDTEIREARWAN